MRAAFGTVPGICSPRLETELPPETCAAALERGQALDLDEVVADLVGPTHRR